VGGITKCEVGVELYSEIARVCTPLLEKVNFVKAFLKGRYTM
jgi:hypothetical protein